MIKSIINQEIEDVPSKTYSINRTNKDNEKSSSRINKRKITEIINEPNSSRVRKQKISAGGHDSSDSLGTVSMFSTFNNPSNYCWFNSALQLIIHAINNEDNVLDNVLPQENQYHNTLLNMLKKFTVPGVYDVGTKIKDPTVDEHALISLKHLMLKAMSIDSHVELDNQQDALHCIQSLLEKIPQLTSNRN